MTVEKRPVSLTSASGSKEYDGKPLTNHKVTVGEATWGTGWVDGQGATYSFTGSQKIVGSSENTFECIPNEGTNLDNYQINKTYGTLTVTDRSEKYQITLTPNSKSVTYDGTEKSVSGFETLEFQINGQTFYVSGVEASAAGTDAGEYPVKVSGQAVVIDSDGNDVTDQFTVNIDDAKLTIVGGDSDKSASNLPHTGDSAAPYAMGICGVAIAAGAGALFTFRKRNNYK
ncbi:LPXTG cell wall anchor domain-containing protein [Collinsella sp. HCP28S3_E12]|uniref:LPXTG cell wall anchor domain-containing protein n=1 Tax=unclassified Collinsella TaxID=2637548 RepID=UPI003F89804D